MPFIWIGISALGGLLTGYLWESEEETPVVTDTKTGLAFGWWDKTLMVIAGVSALYIYKRFK